MNFMLASNRIYKTHSIKMMSTLKNSTQVLKLTAKTLFSRDPYTHLQSTLLAAQCMSKACTFIEYVLPPEPPEKMLIRVERFNSSEQCYEKKSTPLPALAAYLAKKILTLLPAQENFIGPLPALEAYSFAYQHTERKNVYVETPSHHDAMAGIKRQVEHLIQLQLRPLPSTIETGPRPIPLEAYRYVREALCHSGLGSQNETLGFDCLKRMAHASSLANPENSQYLQDLLDTIDVSEKSIFVVRANLRCDKADTPGLRPPDLRVFDNIEAWIKFRGTETFSREPFRLRLAPRAKTPRHVPRQLP